MRTAKGLQWSKTRFILDCDERLCRWKATETDPGENLHSKKMPALASCNAPVPKSLVMEYGMQRLIDIDFLQLLATIFLGVIGIVFTVLQARSSRRQNTLNLYEKWDSPELSEYRSVAWDVWKNLEGAKEDTVIRWLGGDYFGESVDEINKRIPEVQTHAIRSLLNYFARVFEYQKLGLTDRKVTQELFREPWLWVVRLFHAVAGSSRSPSAREGTTRKPMGCQFVHHDIESSRRAG